MKNRLFIVVSCLLLVVSYSAADTLQTAINTSGGGQAAEAGGSKLQLIFGQTPVGEVTVGNTLRLGFLWGTVATETEEEGLIRNTRISRVTDGDIEIRFTAEAQVISANIYRLAEVNNYEFNQESTSWMKVTNVPIPINRNDAVDSGDTAWRESSLAAASRIIAGDRKNAYYRVVPAEPVGLAPIFPPSNNLFGATAGGRKYNNTTVGKVDVSFSRGYTLFELPVWHESRSISEVIGDQMSETDEMYSFNMDKSTRTATAWVGNPLNFEKNRGYYARILNLPAGQTSKLITFVGVVDLNPSGLSLLQGYSMIGNPYPLNKTVEWAFPNFAANTRDELYDKYANKKTCIGSGWAGVEFPFGIGDGFWFKRISSTAYDWRLAP